VVLSLGFMGKDRGCPGFAGILYVKQEEHQTLLPEAV
jgi:hypothetical protein